MTLEIKYFDYRQEEDANEIASIAKQALDTSNNAYDMAYDALNQQTDTSKQVNVLVVQVMCEKWTPLSHCLFYASNTKL